MIEIPINVTELRKQFPFPWSYQQYASGLVRVNDSTGKEVPIPHLVGLAVTVSISLNK